VLDRETFLEVVGKSDLVAAEIGRLLRRRVATIRLREAAPSLSAQAAAAVLPEFDWRSYEAGQVIIREGDRADEFFILVDGEADVSRSDHSGAVTVIARLESGDYFGEMGLLQGTLRNATVTASGAGPVHTLVASRTGFERLVAASETGELSSAMTARIERLRPSR
jgi:CRP-like cAMP-binding protein